MTKTFEQQTLIYTGREIEGTKVWYGYTDDTGKRRYWAKPLKRGIAIGAIFEVERVIDDEKPDTFTARGIGPTVGQIEDATLLATWSATDKAASVILAKITTDRKMQRDAVDPINDAIKVLARAYGEQRTIASRAAFTDYVIAAMHGAR